MAVVDVVNREVEVDEYDVTTHIIEVVRRDTDPVPVKGRASAIDVVRPGGTVVNVSAGHAFPANPYEGMVFIKV